MPDADIDRRTWLLPSLRGQLAASSKTDGRFDMPLLRLVEEAAEATTAGTDEAVEAFLAASTRVSVGNLATIERLELPTCDLAGHVGIVTGGAGGPSLSMAVSPGPSFRGLWCAQGRIEGPDAVVRGRARRERNYHQCGQHGPCPHRFDDRRDDRGPLQSA